MQTSLRTCFISLLIFCAAVSPAAERPGWLGLGYTNQTRLENGRLVRSWFVVRHVLPGSPAEKGGLRMGDLITAIDGKPLRYPSDLEAVTAMAKVKPGQRLRFAVSRLDQRLILTVVAVAMPDAAWRVWQAQHSEVHQPKP